MARNGNGAAVKGFSKGQTMTRAQLCDLADREARSMLGVASRKQAFAMLDRGELDGTIAEVELRQIRFLMGQ